MSKKPLVAAFTAATLAFTGLSVGLAAPANAAQTNDEIEQTVATREDLEAILKGMIESDSTLSTALASLIGSFVTPENIEGIMVPVVEGLIPAGDALVDLAIPLIEELIHSQLGSWGIDDQSVTDLLDSIVEDTLHSDVINSILTSDFVQDVTARAISYAITDAVAQVDLSGLVGAVGDLAMDNAVDAVFGAEPILVAGTPVKAPDIAWLGAIGEQC
ncbi:MAG: hypothetical protein LBJ08_08795, partial [Bifidobacteriaceae bacterium]|nr:hypothetical protein [Bifidobacteriaceae bacterium]